MSCLSRCALQSGEAGDPPSRQNIADVLGLAVNDAADFFTDEESVRRSLTVLQAVGLGYLRLGQPATEVSGGEAQPIKLATELQRKARGSSL
jgi:excinuclease ABC subunit A